MRRCLARPLLLAMTLVGELAVADTSAVGQTQGPTTATDWATKRYVYLQRARTDLKEWEQKVNDFGRRAQAEGRGEDQRAAAELNQSWARFKAESVKLESAAREDWDNAKSGFERASRDLSNRWDGGVEKTK